MVPSAANEAPPSLEWPFPRPREKNGSAYAEPSLRSSKRACSNLPVDEVGSLVRGILGGRLRVADRLLRGAFGLLACAFDLKLVGAHGFADAYPTEPDGRLLFLYPRLFVIAVK